ncbi:hypothetical protein ABEB36_005336 [Hypothenemus hampei]|uniref:Ubiquitin-like domain-containing protein n=1 Tax=Hypothenemus hampei TaxID=57062 RepID=A0ABD1EXW8_HYPHA
MSLIEGVGDEVTQFCFILVTLTIAYIAWWSTSTNDQRPYRTVVLLDRRRHPGRSLVRVRVQSRQLSNHTESVTISEGTSSNSNISLQTDTSTEASLLPDTVDNQVSEPSTVISSSSSSNTNSSQNIHSENKSVTNLRAVDERDIIEMMDADEHTELRHRRLRHFEGARNDNINSEDELGQTPSATTTDVKDTNVSSEGQSESLSANSNNISIKIKYINDDVRIVDGKLKELLGDFKRRHFLEELNANKEVKLIFNGHVLKQNQNSLQSCGLFDNCVVHCLIHQKRPPPRNPEQSQQNTIEQNIPFVRNNNFPHIINANNNNNQGIDWDLGNFLFAVVSAILLTAWYFRYVYAHLYTVTATVGLIIITGIFTIVLVGAYLPNNVYEPHERNLRIRVTRAERIEVQQPRQQ